MRHSLLSLVPAVFTQSPDGLMFADPNLSEIASSAWEALMTDTPTDQVFGPLKLARAIAKGGGMVAKKSTPGGRLFEYPVQYAANPTARGYGEYESFDTSSISVFSAAQYQQRQAGCLVQFSDWSMLRQSGSNEKFDYVGQKLDNGKTSHLNNINNMLYGDGSADNGNAFSGLQVLVPADPTTGIVGAIDPATWIFWRSIQASGAKTTSAGDNVRSSFNTVYNGCSLSEADEAPTNVLTDQTSFQLFVAQTIAVERYGKDSKGTRGFDLGWDLDSVRFNGADLEFDPAAAKIAPGNAWFLNPKHIQFAYLAGGWARLKPPMDLPTQPGMVYQILTIGNLCSGQRRRLGIVTGIS